MAELFPSDTTLNALSGSADSEQAVPYIPVGLSPYHTEFYKMLYRLLDVSRRAGDLRAYKDDSGDLKFGVRAGRYLNGDTPVDYEGTTGQDLTDNAVNYVYLTTAGVLTVNTTGFPTPSTTPHLPLATIATGTESSGGVAGEYAHEDITDYRGRALLAVPTGLAATALQDALPCLVVTGADDGDGTGSATIQAKDAAGNDLAQRFRVRTWIANTDYGSPSAKTDFSVTTGTELAEVIADADYEVICDSGGQVVMNIDLGGAGTVYVLAEVDGRIYSSGAINITSS